MINRRSKVSAPLRPPPWSMISFHYKSVVSNTRLKDSPSNMSTKVACISHDDRVHDRDNGAGASSTRTEYSGSGVDGTSPVLNSNIEPLKRDHRGLLRCRFPDAVILLCSFRGYRRDNLISIGRSDRLRRAGLLYHRKSNFDHHQKNAYTPHAPLPCCNKVFMSTLLYH